MFKSQLTTRDIIVDIAQIIEKINLALHDHEKRLQAIEESNPKFYHDQKTLQAFNKICTSLGIHDLEAPKGKRIVER